MNRRMTSPFDVKCQNCGKGKEACMYCGTLNEDNWRFMCDCGLQDFGYHLIACNITHEGEE